MIKTFWSLLKKTSFDLLLMLMILFFIAYACDKKIKDTSKNFIFNSLDDVPYHKTALVLGTSKNNKFGQINYYFKYRMEAAANLYKAGKVKYILVSGDNKTKDYNEPEDMKIYLMELGVPEANIFLDYAGFRTYDSVVRAQEIFSQNDFIIVSQKFHNERALYIAKNLGIDAVAFNAKDVSFRNVKKRILIREKLARVKLFLDQLLDTKPHFLGEKVHIPEA